MTSSCNDWLLKDRLLNWAGSHEFTVSIENLYLPDSIEQVQKLVKHVDKIRALGTRHCFHDIADSPHNILCTSNLDQIYSLDEQARTVTVGSGICYGQLAKFLHSNGFALPNLASLPHISVGGACATATHGSGMSLGCLATAVASIEIVKADGEIVTLKRGRDEDFNGAVVSLGALGIATKFTLNLIPTFTMKQFAYTDLPMSALKDYFAEIMSSGYSLSLFTEWKNKNIHQVWVKSVVDTGPDTNLEIYGAKKVVDRDLHPINGMPTDDVTVQRGVPGLWYEKLSQYKVDAGMPGVGIELQTEYFVPIEHSYEAIMAVESLHEKIAPHLHLSEIRTINADDFWLSPFYKQRCTAIHFTWKQEPEAIKHVLGLIEEKLKPFKVRPHWGKLFTFSHEYLASIYEKLPDFQRLLNKYDPNGKFRNRFIDIYVFGDDNKN